MSRVFVSDDQYVTVESEIEVEVAPIHREVARLAAGEIESPYWALPPERRDWWDDVCAAVIRAINSIDDAIVSIEERRS